MNGAFVILIEATSDEYGERWAADCKEDARLDDDYIYGIVMPAAKRNLMVVLLQEFLDLTSSTRMLRAFALALQHVHEHNQMHGDVKPLNAVRLEDGTW